MSRERTCLGWAGHDQGSHVDVYGVDTAGYVVYGGDCRHGVWTFKPGKCGENRPGRVPRRKYRPPPGLPRRPLQAQQSHPWLSRPGGPRIDATGLWGAPGRAWGIYGGIPGEGLYVQHQ